MIYNLQSNFDFGKMKKKINFEEITKKSENFLILKRKIDLKKIKWQKFYKNRKKFDFDKMKTILIVKTKIRQLKNKMAKKNPRKIENKYDFGNKKKICVENKMAKEKGLCSVV